MMNIKKRLANWFQPDWTRPLTVPNPYYLLWNAAIVARMTPAVMDAYRDYRKCLEEIHGAGEHNPWWYDNRDTIKGDYYGTKT